MVALTPNGQFELPLKWVLIIKRGVFKVSFHYMWRAAKEVRSYPTKDDVMYHFKLAFYNPRHLLFWLGVLCLGKA